MNSPSSNQALAALAREYEQSAANLTCMIESRTRKIAKAHRDGDRKSADRLESGLADLRAQREHVREIALILKNYYRNLEGNTDET